MASLNFPANPADGDYYEGFSYDGTIGVWKRVGGSGAASMTVSETPPTQGLTSGAMWLDSTTGNTYIYYEDGDNSQWVQSAGVDLQASRGSDFTVQTTAPANPVDGDIWYDPTEGFTYIYYEDQDSSQWVQFGLNRNGAPGIDGADGADGANGIGIPLGGTTGQALVKSSATDYAVEWGSVAGGGGLLELASDTINVDFNDSNSLYSRSVAGDITFTGSNYTAGATKKIYLQGDTVERSLTFPATWNFITDKPAAIGASKKNILDLNSFGTSESTTVAIWLGAGAFSPISATGGTESTILLDGINYKIHEFTILGANSFNITDLGSIGEVEYLIVGGGGGGGNTIGGGGGAGGVRFGTTAVSVLNHTITVGAGGAGGSGGSYPPGSDGSSSLAFSIEAYGGGAGSGYNELQGANIVGSTGGMGAGLSSSPPATPAQGNYGGTTAANSNAGAGGGGYGGVGGNATGSSPAGSGGAGYSSSITGVTVLYAGGGGGGGRDTAGVNGGLGSHRAGNGGRTTAGGNAEPNSGSGGGGGGYVNPLAGGNGGSGIVIVRYPITDPN